MATGKRESARSPIRPGMTCSPALVTRMRIMRKDWTMSSSPTKNALLVKNGRTKAETK